MSDHAPELVKEERIRCRVRRPTLRSMEKVARRYLKRQGMKVTKAAVQRILDTAVDWNGQRWDEWRF